MYKHKIFSVLLISLFSVFSCETDVEVNAPWKEVTIVYGLLSQNDSTHFIKINKAFLGNADATTMAKVRDSSEYKTVSARIEQWKNNLKINTYPLRDTVLTNRVAGSFYYPDQRVYYFYEEKLDDQSQYRLFIVKLDGHDASISASTEIIDKIDSNNVGTNFFNSPNFKIAFVYPDNTQFTDLKEFRIPTSKDGKRYQLSMIFYYNETTNDNVTVLKSFEWQFVPEKTLNTNGGETKLIDIIGKQFFVQVKGRVKNDSNVKYRTAVSVSFILTVAADDFNTYLEVNEPSTGIVQTKPEFTNIQNGIGIFSSRHKVARIGKLLSSATIKELSSPGIKDITTGKVDNYTFGLKFCDPTENDPTSQYFCK